MKPIDGKVFAWKKKFFELSLNKDDTICLYSKYEYAEDTPCNLPNDKFLAVCQIKCEGAIEGETTVCLTSLQDISVHSLLFSFVLNLHC